MILFSCLLKLDFKNKLIKKKNAEMLNWSWLIPYCSKLAFSGKSHFFWLRLRIGALGVEVGGGVIMMMMVGPQCVHYHHLMGIWLPDFYSSWYSVMQSIRAVGWVDFYSLLYAVMQCTHAGLWKPLSLPVSIDKPFHVLASMRKQVSYLSVRLC